MFTIQRVGWAGVGPNFEVKETPGPEVRQPGDVCGSWSGAGEDAQKRDEMAKGTQDPWAHTIYSPDPQGS